MLRDSEVGSRMIDYSKLETGQQLSRKSVVFDAKAISDYATAVDDTSNPADTDGTPLVPPMAIAALALSGAIDALQIPGGTIHASQELEFGTAVPIGSALECTATLEQNSVRRNWRFLIVSLEAKTDLGRNAMRGRGTIMLPV